MPPIILQDVSSTPTHTGSARDWFTRLFLAGWFVAISLPAMAWMAAHYVPLPPPPVKASTKPLPAASGSAWRVVHVLAADCGCSASVAEHLVRRQADATAVEEVWLVGGNSAWQQKLTAAGFIVEPTTSADLETLHGLQGAPWLLIHDATGALRYSGGYAETTPRRGAALADRSLLARLQAGETPEPLPAFGCATGRSLRSALDPIGLKYSNPDRP